MLPAGSKALPQGLFDALEDFSDAHDVFEKNLKVAREHADEHHVVEEKNTSVVKKKEIVNPILRANEVHAYSTLGKALMEGARRQIWKIWAVRRFKDRFGQMFDIACIVKDIVAFPVKVLFAIPFVGLAAKTILQATLIYFLIRFVWHMIPDALKSFVYNNMMELKKKVEKPSLKAWKKLNEWIDHIRKSEMF